MSTLQQLSHRIDSDSPRIGSAYSRSSVSMISGVSNDNLGPHVLLIALYVNGMNTCSCFMHLTTRGHIELVFPSHLYCTFRNAIFFLGIILWL